MTLGTLLKHAWQCTQLPHTSWPASSPSDLACRCHCVRCQPECAELQEAIEAHEERQYDGRLGLKEGGGAVSAATLYSPLDAHLTGAALCAVLRCVSLSRVCRVGRGARIHRPLAG